MKALEQGLHGSDEGGLEQQERKEKRLQKTNHKNKPASCFHPHPNHHTRRSTFAPSFTLFQVLSFTSLNSTTVSQTGQRSGSALSVYPHIWHKLMPDSLRGLIRAENVQRPSNSAAALALLREFPEITVTRAVDSNMSNISLALRSLGWNVLATDIPNVISTVLHQNIANNTHCSSSVNTSVIQVRELDWTIHPDEWTWEHDEVIASPNGRPPSNNPTARLKPPFDLIVSSDTLYIPELVQPLLRTLHALSVFSIATSTSARPPPILLCIERRDPALIDRTLQEAKDVWGFEVSRVPSRKMVKAMEKGGIKWPKTEWEGVEIWKLILNGKLSLDVSHNTMPFSIISSSLNQ
jgi:hypothetical protein